MKENCFLLRIVSLAGRVFKVARLTLNCNQPPFLAYLKDTQHKHQCRTEEQSAATTIAAEASVAHTLLIVIIISQ